ncbi:CPBP family intramembrane glutamic endopeptidase [Nocardiopsis sp. NPDC006198]|uniref:CPBP family intramembrane glutamic endopeptidase n=1 Tax=Nocardiopsis sp. NPDC006198 TaxID=3154472 RepID=UPI0033A5890E
MTLSPEAAPRPPATLSAGRAYALLGVVVAVAYSPSYLVMIHSLTEGLGGPAPAATWSDVLIDWARYALMLGLVIFGCVWVSRRLGLGVRELFTPSAPAPTRSGRRIHPVITWVLGLLAFAGLFAGLELSAVLATPAPAQAAGSAPGPGLDAVLWEVGTRVPNTLATSLIEEMVLLGLIALVLGLAERPAWEVYALSAGIRAAMHAHHGWDALWWVLLGVALMALYRRGTLLPLILAHATYNAEITVLTITLALLFG